MNIEATADLIMSARHSDAFDREACVKILRDLVTSALDIADVWEGCPIHGHFPQPQPKGTEL